MEHPHHHFWKLDQLPSYIICLPCTHFQNHQTHHQTKKFQYHNHCQHFQNQWVIRHLIHDDINSFPSLSGLSYPWFLKKMGLLYGSCSNADYLDWAQSTSTFISFVPFPPFIFNLRIVVYFISWLTFPSHILFRYTNFVGPTWNCLFFKSLFERCSWDVFFMFFYCVGCLLCQALHVYISFLCYFGVFLPFEVF